MILSKLFKVKMLKISCKIIVFDGSLLFNVSRTWESSIKVNWNYEMMIKKDNGKSITKHLKNYELRSTKQNVHKVPDR